MNVHGLQLLFCLHILNKAVGLSVYVVLLQVHVQL